MAVRTRLALKARQKWAGIVCSRVEPWTYNVPFDERQGSCAPSASPTRYAGAFRTGNIILVVLGRVVFAKASGATRRLGK
jgi:hypothetical protein